MKNSVSDGKHARNDIDDYVLVDCNIICINTY